MGNGKPDHQVLMKEALREIKDMRTRLNAMEKDKTEPIAIVGMGCRFPGGADNPETFWRLLRDGRDAISEVPANRWDINAYYDPNPDAPGKMYTRYGGFIGAVDVFDGNFFSITPRESASLDPKQRVLLEVCWESLENAHQPSDRLYNTPVGVFVGIGNFDYITLQMSSLDITEIDNYFTTGSSLCVAAGRISYILGLTGPCFAVDTACSSSLLAVHLACQSLRAKECNLALAGGVNMLLSPEISVNFCKNRMLSADGRCKAFDASGDGYVRGEGCGMVVLKRLSDAQADGDTILALIRGSAVNQDGASGGLTVPSGPSQEQVIRQALAGGKVEPDQVSYIEAHGTGTSLGDPIEIGSIGKVFGRRKEPLIVGSVKTNIGHLESAAGISGLMKVVLSLQHEEIPPNLHFNNPNPRIAWGELPLKIPTKLTPWPAGENPRIAGVSSFGFSGTNVHIVLEEAPRKDRMQKISGVEKPLTDLIDRPLHLLTLSAKTEEALNQLSEKYEKHLLANPLLTPGDIGYSANTGRTHFAHRIAVLGASADQLRDNLIALRNKNGGGDGYRGVSSGQIKPAFLFTGQGSQYVGMGLELYKSHPLFRKTMDHCQEILKDYLEKPLLEVLYSAPDFDGSSLLHETAYTQPALFAVGYALAELWKSWGIKPVAVLGHSVGEYTAACVAGVFSLEDGLKLIAERARLMGNLLADGEMLAVWANETEMVKAVEPYNGTVSIAAVNGPESIVLSGKRGDVEALKTHLEAKGIKTKRLNVSHAFHSSLMEPMLDDFRRIAEGITYATPKIRFISNVTGEFATADVANAEYWVHHVREPVRFEAGMNTLHRQGNEIFLEIGPNPVLLGMGRRCLPKDAGVWLPTLRPALDWRQMLRSLGELYVRGAHVDWLAFDKEYARRHVALPTYPFQRQRHWFKTSGLHAPSIKDKTREIQPAACNPLLGRRLASALKNIQYESQIRPDSPVFLNDHRLFGKVIVPAAAFLEIALAAGADLFKSDHLVLEDVIIQQALVLEENESKTVQTILSAEGIDRYTFQIYSLSVDEDNNEPVWMLHAAGTVLSGNKEEKPLRVDLQVLQGRYEEKPSAVDYYQQFKQRGIDYGPDFQGIEHLWHSEGEAFGRIQLPKPLEESPDHIDRYHLHPVLLDSGFQLLLTTLPDETGQDTYMPVGVKRLVFLRRPGVGLWGLIRRQPGESAKNQTVTASLRLYNDSGETVVSLEGLSGLRTNRDALLKNVQKDLSRRLYEIAWEISSPEVSQSAHVMKEKPRSWLIFADKGGLALALSERLRELGDRCTLVFPGESYGKDGGYYHVNPADPSDFKLLLQHIEPVTGIVHLWSMIGRELASSSHPALSSVLHLVQALAHANLRQMPRLWLVSRGAQAVTSGDVSIRVEQSPLWGLGRVIASEHPDFHDVCLDIDPSKEPNDAGNLLETLQNTDDEDQLAWRNDVRYAARLKRYVPKPVEEETSLNHPFQVTTSDYGILENLTLRPMTRHVPAPGEVEIEVHAAGLNFRDVLRALGMFNTPAKGPALPAIGNIPFGIECAGKISAVGKNVTAFEAGDDVMAVLSIGSLGSFVNVRSEFVTLKPGNMTFEEAATIPLAFLTAYYGLNRLAKIKAGDRVLIHAAAGGVGMAAVQIARHAGAEVFATASPGKWNFLKAMGVRHVMNSRSLDFAEEIMNASGGRGMDIVLNSLNGEFIPKSLEICGKDARFIEIGKIGIWERQQVSNSRSDISYFPFDLGDVATDNPGLITTLFDELKQYLHDGSLQPLRYTVFPVHDAISAFRHMAQARHVGKVVIGNMKPETPGNAQASGFKGFVPNGTYLISGGLGDLGIVVAEWMAGQGARHLVLTGRSPAKPRIVEIIGKLRDDGIEIVVINGDISVEKDVDALFETIRNTLPKLKGIVHAAGVLDDGMIIEQNWDRFVKVMSPKVNGAWNLHRFSLGTSLDFFVMFSSAASLMGNPGQGPYAAANAFLDALAHYRRAEGLPASTVNWGPWSEVGMAIQRNRGDRLLAQGVRGLKPEECLPILEKILREGLAQTCVLDIDWQKYIQHIAHRGKFKLFSNIIGTDYREPQDVSKKSRSELIQKLNDAMPERRHHVILSYIQGLAKKVMGYDASQDISVDKPLMEQGFDSLMAVEMRNRLNKEISVNLPVTLLFDYPTLEKIATFILEEILSFKTPEEAPESKGDDQEATSTNNVLKEIDELLAGSE
ncbi:MAG: beta-ketoacyl synthase [Candidatus Brocadiaceae bacterium]|nr:beta-ketoacyl synthase [Candidatus Brocadiaceae bacterium]